VPWDAFRDLDFFPDTSVFVHDNWGKEVAGFR
jgi:hypothetical protein